MERVLLIDDSLFMRTRLREILENMGKSIIAEAENGNEGIELYKTTKPDLVFLDINMPVLSGRDALIQIINYDANAQVIMCSTMGEEKLIAECIQEGAIYYILKPFTRDNVTKVVREITGETSS